MGKSEMGKRQSYGVAWRIGVAIFAIALMVGGVGGWAATAELAGAVISHGAVVIDHHSKRIQHLYGGLVTEIAVKNGDNVKDGDVLIRLDDTQVRAELAIIETQLLELRSRRARLDAEQQLADSLSFPQSVIENEASDPIMEGETRLFEHNKTMRQGQENQLHQRIEQLTQEQKGYDVQRTAKTHELELIRKELGSTEELLKKNLVPVSRVYALQREEARIDGDRGNFMALEARTMGQISEVEQQILTLLQSARTEAQREIRTVDTRIDELVERRVAARDRLEHMEIKAPQSGVVHELNVHTVGGVISPAEQIMLIVPASETLAIEFKVPPAQIDQVHLGQQARLRFTSFNQRTTPEVEGSVSYVSADISRDQKDRQDYYLARAVVDSVDPSLSLGKKIVPGMPVEVYVTTDKRTALSYFVKPVMDQFSRAFRER